MAVLSVWSLFIGVLDVAPAGLLHGDLAQIEVFLISRLPRLLATLCTGVGMSVAGLIMRQLCMNKVVSPTTGATISSAQLGILLALLFLPDSTLWGRALLAFVFAVLGAWIFVWFIQRMCTSGSFNLLGNDGRRSIIGREIGFENIGVTATESGESSGQGGGSGQGGATATHGNEAPFELIVSLAPDYIFMINRAAADGKTAGRPRCRRSPRGRRTLCAKCTKFIVL